MTNLKSNLIIFFFLLLSGCSSSREWGHKKEISPFEWSGLNKDYQLCEVGTHQSPINLSRDKARLMKQDLSFLYGLSEAKAVDNGYTLEVAFEKENAVIFKDKKFYLRQLHFHSKSEHSLRGLFYPGEIHLVHFSREGEILVVGLFIELSEEESSTSLSFLKSVPSKIKKETRFKIDLSEIFKEKNPHYYYKGSLSTPPCSENVSWLIFDQHLKMREEDFFKFEHFIYHNDRPLQPLKGHELYYSEI